MWWEMGIKQKSKASEVVGLPMVNKLRRLAMLYAKIHRERFEMVDIFFTIGRRSKPMNDL